MKNIKRYKELFESQTELTPEQTEWLDKCTRSSWTLNPQTGLVDVNGHFNCSSQNLTDFKGVRFGVVTRDFNCSYNNLTSLKDAPHEVGGRFYCYNNELTSLEGAPKKVVGSFWCHGNPVSESALENIYDRMQSGMSWPDAVVAEWDSIESDEDKILLAPSNPNLSPEELKGYQALAKLRKRML